jgi:hypothetical protein
MKTRPTTLALLLASLATSSAWGAKADFGFEFDHAPSVDGAGYVVQPTNNVRADGSMAYEVGQTVTLPSGVGSLVVDGQGFNNGDGTFSYDAADDGRVTAAMGFVQGEGTGTAATPIPTPLVNQRNFTLEARIKLENIETGDADPNTWRFFDFENNAKGSLHFVLSYGNKGGLFMSTPGAGTAGVPNIGIVQGEWITLRAVGTSLAGPANTGKIESFIKLSDTEEWVVGPMVSGTFSTTRDRGTLAIVCGFACGGDAAKVTVDYIRGVNQSLALTDALDAAGGEPIAGDFNGDGSVNAADFAVWQSGFGGALKGGDLLAWQRNFGTTAAAVSAASVPEASACGLALCGLAALAARRRTQSTVC